MINYKHLHYFWLVAREGSVIRASELLHLTPQTISGQLTQFEARLGEPLFNRVGRHLELSDTGRSVFSYAEEIFALGHELEQMLRSLPEGRPMTLRVGVADMVPKSIATRLLLPAQQAGDAVRFVCREGTVSQLLAQLAIHRLDLVIADGPIPPNVEVKGFNHLLGECGVSFLATPTLAGRLEGAFPACLNNAPLLLPGETTLVRSQLMRWFDRIGVRPRITGEFEDSALMKAFGGNGVGVFAVPTPIVPEVCRQFGVEVLGETDAVKEQFYAISGERRISHPAVAEITRAASEWLQTDRQR